MISQKMQSLVQNSSVIRAMFEEGNRLAKIYGPENVFDFSIGNPSVAPRSRSSGHHRHRPGGKPAAAARLHEQFRL